MRIRNLELTVGVFILAGVLALTVLALRVAGLTPGSTGSTYSVHAYFDNVAGLTSRAKVTMSGVTIGQVTAIEFDKNRYSARVDMAIDSDVDTLPADSTASILTAGLLGEKYVGISVGGEEDLLVDGSEIYDTQSALVLEELIGRFLLNTVSKED
ncbi:MAG: outer membrane lipid asymmetry maintenance protein MlaD [Pseudomonadales bacterium]|jgi:phospholipid/cholesterol/gamma-HCH transport system substrate-binding protein|uniref:Phospholipid/cholesterol/gamma-HCH transport system substrate-binding protein n=1 Tax=Halopseudomonas aestusnigri TaxID=857252 RepID=A0AAQ1G3Y3_9GAMM|nr:MULTISPECIES: outer membrane lipid asymmetry maintenance protein MlaD [Halopseudomonas]MAD27707.1 outer membrane lipid asymmetry maintenance protein MlaD [Pseudomonadales bacterium]MEE2798430.1 outer membrane lipid asymmetry maintenance protein MlaD [Pseudomonadota bacterium]HBT57311.1 outer membrane lipid asymmetry maintenance protein MlaD [Pseudomonas sp.]MAH00244.1 outer membrane lipid asymmetry maintenance protein MlaD [Pseudomonadales bacterium]MAK72989.1 outer membrane lipid asymmetry|tara:strand:+ start:8840 stop:9304 length:465 start_codon:yes stop_codon:yes gene_type:complete